MQEGVCISVSSLMTVMVKLVETQFASFLYHRASAECSMGEGREGKPCNSCMFPSLKLTPTRNQKDQESDPVEDLFSQEEQCSKGR